MVAAVNRAGPLAQVCARDGWACWAQRPTFSFRHQEIPALCPSHHFQQLRYIPMMAGSCGIGSGSTDNNAMTPEPAPVSAAAEHVVLTRVAEDRWSDLRDVRLAALADSPTAFGSSLRSEVSFDEARWRQWARSAALFMALASGSPVGMAAGVAGQTSAERKLVALWVAPQWRGVIPPGSWWGPSCSGLGPGASNGSSCG